MERMDRIKDVIDELVEKRSEALRKIAEMEHEANNFARTQRQVCSLAAHEFSDMGLYMVGDCPDGRKGKRVYVWYDIAHDDTNEQIDRLLAIAPNGSLSDANRKIGQLRYDVERISEALDKLGSATQKELVDTFIRAYKPYLPDYDYDDEEVK